MDLPGKIVTIKEDRECAFCGEILKKGSSARSIAFKDFLKGKSFFKREWFCLKHDKKTYLLEEALEKKEAQWHDHDWCESS